jgi:hypothetical protein
MLNNIYDRVYILARSVEIARNDRLARGYKVSLGDRSRLRRVAAAAARLGLAGPSVDDSRLRRLVTQAPPHAIGGPASPRAPTARATSPVAMGGY